MDFVKTQENEFLSLIAQHKGILYKICKMYTNDPEDRNDLSQEIILQLWKSYGTFKAQSTFATWMYRVSLNVALTFLKRSSRKIDDGILFPETDLADIASGSHKEDQLEYFYKAVQELLPVEKALIFLFLEGETHHSIGQHLGISEGNARVKLNRTKEKLQLIIKKNGYEY
jgi:RNA polymerase sigma factor (sigma-70 family)